MRRASSARGIARRRSTRTGVSSATGRPREVIVTCSPACRAQSSYGPVEPAVSYSRAAVSFGGVLATGTSTIAPTADLRGVIVQQGQYRGGSVEELVRLVVLAAEEDAGVDEGRSRAGPVLRAHARFS